MTRALGALLLALCAAAAGLLAARDVRRTGAALCDLEAACARMAALMRYQMPTLPALLRLSADGLGAPAARLLYSAADALERDAACTCAQAFARAKWPDGLPPDARRAVSALAGSLGRTDAEGQLRAIELAARQLGSVSERFSRERAGRERSRCALGLGAALVLMILLR